MSFPGMRFLRAFLWDGMTPHSTAVSARPVRPPQLPFSKQDKMPSHQELLALWLRRMRYPGGLVSGVGGQVSSRFWLGGCLRKSASRRGLQIGTFLESNLRLRA